MNLGPSILPISLREILKKNPHKKSIKKFHKRKIEWADKSLQSLKKEIRLKLRTVQQNRCIYCRRIIKIDRRNPYEDIEHYLDKSKNCYRKWAFSNINLTLSCRACNFVKTTKDLGTPLIQATNNIKNHVGQFKWLHPYFDDYHANIEILPGWVYKVRTNAPSPLAAQRLISECELDEISHLEMINEQRKERIGKIISLVAKSAKTRNQARTIKLSNFLENEYAKIWFDW